MPPPGKRREAHWSREESGTGTAIFVGDFLGVLLIYPLFLAWEKRQEERSDITGLWLGASLFSLGCIVASFYVAHWFLYFALPALIFVVIGTGSLYAHLSLTISIFLFIVLSARVHEFANAGSGWLEVLAISTSATISILALIIQQRSLLNEKDLRRQWMVTANHDALTGLPNRGHSRFLIQHEVLRLKRNPGTFSLALLDLDNFKEINDTYGHAAGDRVLVELSRRLLEAFRESDLISRYGGEEFLIMLLGTVRADARDLIDKVRRDIAEHPFDLGEEWVHITFSAGVAEYEPGGDSGLTELIKMADKRLYNAKRAGRNQVVD